MRDEFPGGKVIPADVGFSRHARRSLAADFVAKYRGALHGVGLLGGFENPIRQSVGGWCSRTRIANTRWLTG